MIDKVLTKLVGPMMDASTLDKGLDGLIAAVEGRRADGLSVSAACRAAGISTSTYYRRRKAVVASEATPAAAPVSPAWPFSAATPRAPFYWDQVFADEMSDSFVRRELGAGARNTRTRHALAALAAPQPPLLERLFPTLAPSARHMGKLLRSGSIGAAARPVAVIALLAALVVAGGWIASVAANPAAWVSHPDPAQVAEAIVDAPR